MKQLNKKTPLVFRAGVVLLCLLTFSMHLTSGLYAKYTTVASGSDSARVAKFSFSDDLATQYKTLTARFAPGDAHTTEISIENNGEVALRYVVKIENLTNNLPIDSSIISSDDIAIGEKRSFSWAVKWEEEDNSVEYMGKMDVIRISVAVEQID